MKATLEQLSVLEASLRKVGASTRDAIALDGFDLFIDPSSDAYHLSFAVPRAQVSQADVAAMCQAFASRKRRPRLEYIEALHPALAALLEQAGFEQEMRAPVMTLTPDQLASAPEVKGSLVLFGSEDVDRLEPYLRGQSFAYGGDGGEGALIWLASMREGLLTEKLMVMGLEQSGHFVSGASIQIGGATGELAGVWTLPDAQRQGYGYAVCQQLLAVYFQAGYALCWLSAAEGALRLYETLGFERVGTQLNYGLPATR